MHLFYSNVKLKVLFIFPTHVSSFSPKHKFTSPNIGPKAASKATLNASLYTSMLKLRSCTTSVPAERNYFIYQNAPKKVISTFYISLFLCSHQVFIGYK